MSKYNGELSRVAFWHGMTTRLAEFASLIHHQEHLRPDDVRALKEIHRALYECYVVAKDMQVRHRKELGNASRVADKRKQRCGDGEERGVSGVDMSG